MFYAVVELHRTYLWTIAGTPKLSIASLRYSCHLKDMASPIFSDFAADHGLINYIETKAKGFHLKKLTCKGTLMQVFIRVYSLEIHFNNMLVFLTQLCKLLTL